MKRYSRVLALGAHTDDIELGCGAFLSRLAREGADIAVMAFSRAELSLAPDMDPDTLEREFRDSMALLGVDDIYVGKVPVRRFPEFRQEILEELVVASREFQPDLVLTMNSQDTHQDHQVVHQESVRAFRGRSLLGYETPWNQQQNVTELFVEVAPEDVERKVSMLAAYRSQIELGRPYMESEYVDSAATFRGYQSRLARAEAFEVITMTWGL